MISFGVTPSKQRQRVAPVGGDPPVVGAKGIETGCLDRFLANVGVEEAPDQPLLVGRLGPHLEIADQAHPVERLQQLLFSQCLRHLFHVVRHEIVGHFSICHKREYYSFLIHHFQE